MRLSRRCVLSVCGHRLTCTDTGFLEYWCTAQLCTAHFFGGLFSLSCLHVCFCRSDEYVWRKESVWFECLINLSVLKPDWKWNIVAGGELVLCVCVCVCGSYVFSPAGGVNTITNNPRMSHHCCTGAIYFTEHYLSGLVSGRWNCLSASVLT